MLPDVFNYVFTALIPMEKRRVGIYTMWDEKIVNTKLTYPSSATFVIYA